MSNQLQIIDSAIKKYADNNWDGAFQDKRKAELFSRAVLTLVKSDTNLQKCTPESIFYGCFVMAQLGLSPEKELGQAYLVPFGAKATLIIGYKGFIELVENIHIFSHVRYEKDTFKEVLGTSKSLIHEPCDGDRGKPVGAYAVALFPDGFQDHEYLSADEIESIRKRSPAKSSGPWVTDTMEMWKKTVIRRLAKRLPKQPKLQRAVTIDEEPEIKDITAQAKVSDVFNKVNEIPLPEPQEEPQPVEFTDDVPPFKPEPEPAMSNIDIFKAWLQSGQTLEVILTDAGFPDNAIQSTLKKSMPDTIIKDLYNSEIGDDIIEILGSDTEYNLMQEITGKLKSKYGLGKKK